MCQQANTASRPKSIQLFAHIIDWTVVMATKTQLSGDLYEIKKLTEYDDTATSDTQP